VPDSNVVEEETDSVALLDAPDELMKRPTLPRPVKGPKSGRKKKLTRDKIQARQPKLVAKVSV